ncbi:TPR repeat region-containing protein [Fodinicola feengrottensis]|uniref:TPR repeat region-containing protein n=1 Tax=Fodinicola feengrottensis TaxID=435914 RepID=UPI0013D1F13D|nr:hypothetical protein [Fodinicola feengrottensis]
MAATPDIPDTPADPGTIDAAANQLRGVAAVISGHGSDVNSAVNTAALQFSEVIAGPIKDLAGKNLAAFEAAYGSATYGADIAHNWSLDVQDFKTKRNALLAEWQQALSTGFGVARPLTGRQAEANDITPEEQKASLATYHSAVDSAQNDKAGDITGRAHALLEFLRTQANDLAGRVQHDPNDADLQALAKAGALSWGSYVAFPGHHVTPPVTAADAQHAAQVLNDAANGKNVSQEDVRRALELLDQVNSGAAAAIAAGVGVSAGVLAYLTTLYNGLGGNVFKLPDYLSKSGFNDADKGRYTTDLGSGLLLLSNENLKTDDPNQHGGFDRLPPEVRSLLTDNAYQAPGPYNGVQPVAINRPQDWNGLLNLLGNTPPNISPVARSSPLS